MPVSYTHLDVYKRQEATDRQDRTERSERKVLVKRDSHTDNPRRPRIFRPRGEETTGNNHSNYNRPFDRDRKKISGREKEGLRQKHYSKKKLLAHRLKNEDENAELRLNRYISMGGVCSRRDADEMCIRDRYTLPGPDNSTNSDSSCFLLVVN